MNEARIIILIVGAFVVGYLLGKWRTLRIVEESIDEIEKEDGK